jgi:hypothetical protein
VSAWQGRPAVGRDAGARVALQGEERGAGIKGQCAQGPGRACTGTGTVALGRGSGDGDPGFLGARQGGLGGGSRRERKGALGDGGAQGWRRRADGCARDGHGQGEVQGPCRNQGRQGDWRGAGGKGVGFRRLEEKNGRESGRRRAGRKSDAQGARVT